MGKNIFNVLSYDSAGTHTFVVPAASTRVVDVDLYNCIDAKCIVEVTYEATHASTTGVTLTAYYGMGAATDSNFKGAIPAWLHATNNTDAPSGAVMSDNGDAVTMVTVPTGQSSTVTKRTYFIVSDPINRTSRYLRLSFTNTDVTNAATLQIFLDT